MRKILVLLFLIPSLAFAGWPIGGSPNSGGGGGEHNALEGLQGGAADEYYHLDFMDYIVVSDMAAAGVAPDANRFYLSTAAATWTLGTFSAFGLTFIALADAAAARTNLGLGALATGDDAGDVPIAACLDDTHWNSNICPAAVQTALDELADRTKTLEGAGGGGRWDWTQAVGSPAAADWTDASSYGAAVSLAALEDGAVGTYVRMEPGAAGSDPYGALFAVASGDWTYGFRFGRVTVDGAAAVALNTKSMDLQLYAVFVDGTDLTTDPWYGAGIYMANQDWNSSSVGSVYGTNWAGAFGLAGQDFIGVTGCDIFLKRSGTSLEAFLAPTGQTPIKAGSWTVTAGAGLLGIRLRHADANHKHIARVDAYGALAGVPGVD